MATDPLSIYIHWPFCQAKCPYCDFNSHVVASVDTEAWAEAYRAEVGRLRAELGARQVRSVFFGGGTPSLMPPALVDGILADLHRAWGFANDVEVTLEANPTSVEAHRFSGYRTAGVSRISVGVQSLRDVDLRALGRLHSAEEARAAVALAQSVFDRVSLDLIYARQNQGIAGWQAELAEALALGTDHLSLYQLTIEDGTAFGDRHKLGRMAGLPSEDLAADLYAVTQEMAEAAGLRAYEISNHARPDAEARHNVHVWRGQEYVGIGPGAHGRVRTKGHWVATMGHKMPAVWLAAVRNGSGEAPRSVLSREERGIEYLLMSLRLAEGSLWAQLPEGLVDPGAVDDLVASGHLWCTDARLGTTPEGRPLLNSVLRALLA